jgi:hypothetical protein
MKTHKHIISVAAMLVFIMSGTVVAQDNIVLSIYRDANGHLTPQSRQAAKEMTRIASRSGRITLWLTLNFEFNVYFDERTDQAAIEAQNRAVRDGFDDLLNPMIARGAVRHPKAGPLIQGPGCYVQATVDGLRRLIKDDRLLQIVAVE